MPLENLNLLLRQQIINRANKIHVTCSIDSSKETLYHEKYSNSIDLYPKTENYEENCASVSEECEDIRSELINIDLEEASAYEEHKALCDKYELLESVLEHLLTNIDSVILEAKSSLRLSSAVNNYAMREGFMTDQISRSLKMLIGYPDMRSLDEVKAKLLLALNNHDHIKKLTFQRDEKKSNYKLALKNFKIILEILNITDDSLQKLKQQFDEVLVDYQHCRCILHQELTIALKESTKVLGECLDMLGNDYNSLAGRRLEVNNVLKDLCQRINISQQEYMFSLKGSDE